MNTKESAEFSRPDKPPLSGGSWSLLDVLKLDALAFAKTNGVLAGIQLVIKQAESMDPNEGEQKISSQIEASAKQHLLDLSAAIKPLNLKISNLAIQRLRTDLGQQSFSHRQLREKLAEIKNRIYDELESVNLYFIDPAKAYFLNSTDAIIGGEERVKFPEIDFDIEEAGKCFALGRGTACVFHLMRVMESVVRALCTDLNIANPNREWGKLLSAMGRAIEGMPKGDKRNSWSEAHSLLYSVKQAWRNDTMHPNKTYTEEQAEDILRAVKRFIQQLATLI